MILTLPTGLRLQPHRKGFCKVFSRMRLSVPCVEIQNEVAAVGPWLVELRVWHAVQAEHLGPASPRVKAVGVIDGMSGLVSQNPHALTFACSFHLEHLRTLQLHQPRMGEIK